jgi:hypothetical protein
MLDPHAEHWLTYAQVGELLGISSSAARMVARRQGWPRRSANAVGAFTLVLVPDAVVVQRCAAGERRTLEPDQRTHDAPAVAPNGDDRDEPATSAANEPATSAANEPATSAANDAASSAPFSAAVTAFGAAVAALSATVEAERERVARAERRIAEVSARAEQQIEEVYAAQIELYAALTDAREAERIAALEAAALRGDADLRRRWGALRRWRWALTRR